MEHLLVFGVGILGGILGSLSSGGGILTIPFLLFLGYPPIDVMGTTRVGSLVGGVGSTYKYHQSKRIDWKTVKSLALVVAIAGLIGPLFFNFIKGDLIVDIIGVMLALVGVFMLFSNRFSSQIDSHKNIHPKLGYLLIFVATIYSAMFGAGGGIIIINLLVLLFGFKVTKASATGITIWLVGTGAATLSYLVLGHVILGIAISLSVGSLIGAYFGAKYLVNKNPVWIKNALAVVLFVSSIKLLFF